jgi:hypothetical protein
MSRKTKSRPNPNKERRLLIQKIVGPAFIVAAALLAIWPMLQKGPSYGADFSFHFVSWLDAQQSQLSGIPYPHWATSPNFSAGEPRFVFYPPLVWMAGAFLGLLLPWGKVSIALAFLLLAGTGFAHRALALEILEDGPATLAGCASIFLGNLLVDLYMRSDYAELTGGIWIPLLLLFLLRVPRSSGTVLMRSIACVVPLALVIAGIWLTNGPLGIMASYLLIAVSIVSAALHKSWVPAVRAALSFALGLGMASVYLLPAVWERGWTNLSAAISQREYVVENGWLLTRHTDSTWALYDTTLVIHSWLTIIMFSVSSAALLITWKRGIMKSRRAWWTSIALIPVAVLLLQFPISEPIWKWLPALRFLQFPWRWLVVMLSPLAVSFAAAVWIAPLRGRVPILAGCGLLFFFISGGAWGVCYQDGRDIEAAIRWAVQDGGIWGKPEYSPPGIRHPLVDRDTAKNCEVDSLAKSTGDPTRDLAAPEIPRQMCVGAFSEVENRPERKVFMGIADHDGFLILNLRSYPAWQVRVNGQLVRADTEPRYGLLAVPILRGPVNVDADWTTTNDVWAGRALSALSILLLTLVFVLERKATAVRLK